MARKLTLDGLQVESFETTGEAPARGTVYGAQTEAFFSCPSDCGDQCGTGGTGGTGGGETAGCPGPSDEPCTWYQVFTCESNQIAYPSQCTGCGADCQPTFDYCPSGPGYHC